MATRHEVAATCSWCLGEFFARQQRNVAYCSPLHRQKAYRFRDRMKNGLISFEDVILCARTLDFALGSSFIEGIIEADWPNTDEIIYTAEDRRKLLCRFQARLFEDDEVEDLE